MDRINPSLVRGGTAMQRLPLREGNPFEGRGWEDQVLGVLAGVTACCKYEPRGIALLGVENR
jgi:hypothetical protein